MKAAKISPRNPVLPMLENVLFKEGKAMCGNIGRVVEMSSYEFDGLEGCVPLSFLKKICATSDSIQIKFVSNNGTLIPTIHADEMVTTLPDCSENTENLSELFDKFISITHTSVYNYDSSESIFAASKTVSKDELRIALQFIEFNKDHIASTDAHKLLFFKNERPPSETFYLSGFVASLLKPKMKSTISLSGDPTKIISVSNNGLTYHERTDELKYPDYRAVIPEDPKNMLRMGNKDLQDVCKKLSVVANSTTKLITISLSEDEIIATAEDLDFETKGSIDLIKKGASYTGDPMRIGFNANILQSSISLLTGSCLEIALTSPNKAALIDGELIVMPVMIDR